MNRLVKLFFLLLIVSPSFAQVSYLQKKIGKNEMPYLLYLPKDFKNNGVDKWPLILSLHGIGEAGNDLDKLKKQGLPRVLDQKPDFPCIVLAPQCRRFRYWNIAMVKDLLDEVVKELNVDKSRIYITGTSMGGFATWGMATTYPETFAAIVPICGGGNKSKVSIIKDKPIWVFHGAKDRIVPLWYSKRMVEALLDLNSKVRFTIYPNAGHKCWSIAYEDPELYDWLFQQKNKSLVFK